jgi:hypothetical protein
MSDNLYFSSFFLVLFDLYGEKSEESEMSNNDIKEEIYFDYGKPGVWANEYVELVRNKTRMIGSLRFSGGIELGRDTSQLDRLCFTGFYCGKYTIFNLRSDLSCGEMIFGGVVSGFKITKISSKIVQY